MPAHSLRNRSLAAAATFALAVGLTLVSATAASAAPVVTYSDLQTAFTASGSVELTAPISSPASELALSAGATVSLDLAGQALTLHSIQMGAGSQLTILDSSVGQVGVLTADASDSSTGAYADSRAGIWVPTTATLIISSGTVHALGGGLAGAGIGAQGHGGGLPSVGTIQINGGTVVATGLGSAAGIGAAAVMSGGSISIAGGSVTATSGANGAGIGGGFFSAVNDVTISAGTVIATGAFGAGIGGGDRAADGTGVVSITGGTVTASAPSGAAIGSGFQGGVGGSVTISGGTVTATGDSGAGIGGGLQSNGPPVTISGGTVNATGNTGAGVGGGSERSNSVILITAPANLTASSTNGAGIGSGAFTGSTAQIQITGGTLTVSSGAGAAIGGGFLGGSTDIIISGGTVVAHTASLAPVIGSGVAGGSGGSILVDAGADVSVDHNQASTVVGGANGTATIVINGTLRIPETFLLAPTTGGLTVGATGRITGAGELTGAATVVNNGSIGLVTVTATDVQVHNFLVTFNTAGPQVRVYASTFADGERSFAPDPTKSGSVFTGWFTQAVGGTPFTPTSTITADVTVFPHWGPALAATGIDSSAGAIGAAVLLLLGAGFIVYRRRHSA